MHVPYHTYSNETKEYLDSHVVHTGQLFFEEDFYKQITSFEPYVRDKHRRVHNDEDHDYREDPTAVLDIVRATNDLQDGVIGSITTVIDPAATPSPAPMLDSPKMLNPYIYNSHSMPFSPEHRSVGMDLIRYVCFLYSQLCFLQTH